MLITTVALGGSPAAPASPTRATRVDAAVERAVKAQAAEQARQAARITKDEIGGFRIELTVTPEEDARLRPDYAAAGKTVRGLGVPRGGQSGSPSFDTLTQTYWWED
jgi:hypothetical protein